MTSVTIGWLPREQFGLAVESLKRLLELTEMPFELIVVDCNTPAQVWREIAALLERHPNASVIRRDEYLLPNQSRNLVIERARGDYLCLIENDVLVREGWLSRLLAACEEHPADVAVPLILEEGVHFDEQLGAVREVEEGGTTQLEIVPRDISKDADPGSRRRRVEFIEQHCVLFRRHVFDRIGPYDEALSTRDEIDLSLALRRAGVPVVFEPASVVEYLSPWPPGSESIAYSRFKWDLERGLASCERIKERWNLKEVPGGDAGFARKRYLTGRLCDVREEIGRLISPGEPVVLVDDDTTSGTSIVEGLRTIPFLERDGAYWGAPADDATAIRELERLREGGARLIVFLWVAFWWLEQYPAFLRHLDARYARVIDEDHMLAFDLAQGPRAGDR
jgi:hypothetical protein